jgi:DNA polymerase III subunit epsilon
MKNVEKIKTSKINEPRKDSKLKKLSSIKNFTTLDLEVTGSNPKKDSIVAVYITKVVNLQLSESRTFWVSPPYVLSKSMIDFLKIDFEKIEKAKLGHEVRDDIISHIGKEPLFIHMAAFDNAFLKQQLNINCEKNGIEIYDTLALARTYLPDLKKYKLSDIDIILPSLPHKKTPSEQTAQLSIKIINRLFKL